MLLGFMKDSVEDGFLNSHLHTPRRSNSWFNNRQTFVAVIRANVNKNDTNAI